MERNSKNYYFYIIRGFTVLKLLKLTFRISAGCMLLLALSFILMPVANEKSMDGENWWLILSGLLFWIPLILGYLFFFITDRLRRKIIKQKSRNQTKIKTWGIFRIGTNPEALIFDVGFAICLLAFLIFLILKADNLITYVFLCLTIFAFHMHCMLNGVNYNNIFKNKTNAHKTKQEEIIYDTF